MGKLCAVFGCTVNSASKCGISVFSFPHDPPERRRAWINFVKTKRKDFRAPAPHSVICAKHFAPECFENEHIAALKANVGLKTSGLKPGTVPTIYSESTKSSAQDDTPRKQRRLKRELMKSINDLREKKKARLSVPPPALPDAEIDTAKHRALMAACSWRTKAAEALSTVTSVRLEGLNFKAEDNVADEDHAVLDQEQDQQEQAIPDQLHWIKIETVDHIVPAPTSVSYSEVQQDPNLFCKREVKLEPLEESHSGLAGDYEFGSVACSRVKGSSLETSESLATTEIAVKPESHASLPQDQQEQVNPDQLHWIKVEAVDHVVPAPTSICYSEVLQDPSLICKQEVKLEPLEESHRSLAVDNEFGSVACSGVEGSLLETSGSLATTEIAVKTESDSESHDSLRQDEDRTQQLHEVSDNAEPLTEEICTKIVDMAAQGVRTRVISEQLGLSFVDVSAVLKQIQKKARVSQRNRTAKSITCSTITCYICDQTMSDIVNYGSHLAEQHGKLGFRCPRCGQCCLSAALLTRHIKYCRLCLSTGKFGCTLCPLDFHRPYLLALHHNRQHGTRSLSALRCPHCARVFQMRQNVAMHVQSCILNTAGTRENAEGEASPQHGLIEVSASKTKCPKCYICSQSMSDTDVYISHLAGQHGVSSCHCPKCGQNHSSESQLEFHVRQECLSRRNDVRDNLFLEKKIQHTSCWQTRLFPAKFHCLYCGLFSPSDKEIKMHRETECMDRNLRVLFHTLSSGCPCLKLSKKHLEA